MPPTVTLLVKDTATLEAEFAPNTGMSLWLVQAELLEPVHQFVPAVELPQPPLPSCAPAKMGKLSQVKVAAPTGVPASSAQKNPRAAMCLVTTTIMCAYEFQLLKAV